jgi:hypothetical protein
VAILAGQRFLFFGSHYKKRMWGNEYFSNS